MNAPASSLLAAIKSRFLERIESRDIKIGIIGLGYVGLPLLEAFVLHGYRVTGFDIDPAKKEALEAGRSYIQHISDERVGDMLATKRFAVSIDLAGLAEMDAIIICVPTPLGEHREPDLSYIVKTTEAIAEGLQPGQLVVLESTTYPGTTDEVMRPILERGGLKAGADFALAYSPEREDPGNVTYGTASIPKVVGAESAEGAAMAVALYRTVVSEVVPVSDTRTAEAVKLTENIFRAVNIALVNELKVVFNRMDIDVWEVIDAAKTKPFGFMPFYPGPGLGGHCIPIDPFYLTWKAQAYGLHTRFIELAGEINNWMPHYVISTLVQSINDVLGKALKGSKILVVGVAYKKNVDDLRESPSLELIEMLQARGAEVSYYDPHIPVVPQTREHGNLAGMESTGWSADVIENSDAVLIATDHDAVDYGLLAGHADLVIDTRNAMHGIEPGKAVVVRA